MCVFFFTAQQQCFCLCHNSLGRKNFLVYSSFSLGRLSSFLTFWGDGGGRRLMKASPYHVVSICVCLSETVNCRSVDTVNQHADVTGVQPCTTPWESPSDFHGFSPSSSSPSECNSDQGKSPLSSSKNLHFLYKSEGKASFWPSIKLTIQSASHLSLRPIYLCIFCTTFL